MNFKQAGLEEVVRGHPSLDPSDYYNVQVSLSKKHTTHNTWYSNAIFSQSKNPIMQ